MSIISNAKEIAELVQKLGNIELKKRIVDLQAEIIELAGEKIGLQEEKQALEAKCNSLAAQLELKLKLTYRAPVYHAEGDATPFCPLCWEVRKNAVHLEKYDVQNGQGWFCQHCEKVFVGPGGGTWGNYAS